MMDDKSGVHLRIPAIMINYLDSQIIKNALLQDKVIATYEVAHPNRNESV
jgi:hypothetical protein